MNRKRPARARRAGGFNSPQAGGARSTRPIEVHALNRPEAVVTYPMGETQQVRLAGTVISRIVLQPGWNWLEHAQPLVGTASCELYHRGVVLSGWLGIRTDAGEEVVVGPNHVFDISPGHVIWVERDEALVMLDWAGGAGFGVSPGEGLRQIETMLFTDIVDSTGQVERAGDVAWKRTVGMHDDVVRSVLTAFGGREIVTAGDSFLVLFDSSEQAIRCGLALVSAVATIDIAIRVGIHTGEVALTDDNVRGMAVHIASRILDLAGPGEVLVSRITRELAEGARGLTFESRGPHRLKGVAREHEVFAARFVP
jgi:class 3 adenylate cyclase